MTEELYANPISQPSRAVHWLCKANNYPIQFKNTNVHKGESRTEAFLQLSPIGKIPVLKDGDFVLTESHAIMIYLADKHGWESWCPTDKKIRARIHEYMNWHHLNTRRSSEIFFNQLMVNIGRGTPGMEAMLAKKQKVIADMFRILEFWLRHGNLYLVSNSKPTVVDLSCYNEVVQLEVMGLLTDIHKDFPKSAAWLKRMKHVPHHDEMLAPMGKFFRKFKLAAKV
ncbi:Glutathione S-transferase theta-1 [Phytophthora boehmeriae]|uniref:Glutathione S-transferase theta-1 n=1 Tax=Phytophthora boehmeriae TaxID=109152 RepID=A0A8T1WM73_9STRA|nr:Glutathione S-transferase theta-1 [Phytophthora boehmeriae]